MRFRLLILAVTATFGVVVVSGLVWSAPRAASPRTRSVTVPSSSIVPPAPTTTVGVPVGETQTAAGTVSPGDDYVASPPVVPAVSPPDYPDELGAFLECVKQREGGGDYSINTGNGYYGTFQFLQSTWDNTAEHAGRPDLVGVHASDASPADQDAMALALFEWQGPSPWAGGNYPC